MSCAMEVYEFTTMEVNGARYSKDLSVLKELHNSFNHEPLMLKFLFQNPLYPVNYFNNSALYLTIIQILRHDKRFSPCIW